MRKLVVSAIMLFLAAVVVAQPIKSWEKIHSTPLGVAQANFERPPVEFTSEVILGLQGDITVKTIKKDLDSAYSKGFRSVMFEAGAKTPFKYLSNDWFKFIKSITAEAKKLGMKVWLIDEGKYPSGFAGGKFSEERPELRMQALVVCQRIEVAKNEIIKELEVDKNAISAVAVSLIGERNKTIEIKDGKISFRAGLDDWEILLIRPDFKTAVTASVNNSTGGKTSEHSIMDYLNPEAVDQFIDWTHNRYKSVLGKELGTTVLGFRGDEPDYAHTPWTPRIIDIFKANKGYDPTPYLAAMFAPVMTEHEKRVKADYWDVWSEMFANSFFKRQADWCEANGIAHITHLNNEHNMPVCVRAEGDFFRTLSKVQIPGVDAIWNQIYPDTINNFPKLASSVAHVYGKPRSFSESFAAYYTPPTTEAAKFAVNYQIVRGINFFEFMFWMAGSQRPNWMTAPGTKNLNDYTNRVTYMLSQGIPGAKVAMYYPTSSIWLGNNTVAEDIKALTQTMMEHQRDFDYINDDAFSEAITTAPGCLVNKSGQRYYTLIVPSADVISLKAWKVIEEFVSRGGKLLFWGNRPKWLSDNTFTQMTPFPDFEKALYESSNSWSATVAAAMPRAEVDITNKLYPTSNQPAQGQRRRSQPDPTKDLRYTRRILPDAELFFLFNEGKSEMTFTAEFDIVGKVKIMDANNGEIKPTEFTIKDDRTCVRFTLGKYETALVSIQKDSYEFDIKTYGALGTQVPDTKAIQATIDAAYANGGGCVVIPEGRYITGALFFKCGVDLNIRKGATLVSTVNHEDFPPIATRFEGTEQKWKPALINFDNSDGVKVFGDGTIDGKGVEWRGMSFANYGRPRMFMFTNCNGGSISGLKMRDHASWGLTVLYTDGFTISDMDIRAAHNIPSSDGIDIDSSNDVKITGTYIDVNDDCISIKSGKDADGIRVGRPSENILIEKCHFAYGHGGVALGSEVSGGIRNVMIRDCVMDADNWGPIRFKSQPSRSGVVENITFRDITLNNTRSVFDINMSWRMVPPIAPAAEVLTQLKNIKIINVKGTARSVGAIIGLEGSPVSNITIENCDIKATKGLRLINVKDINLSGLKLEVSEGEKIIEK